MAWIEEEQLESSWSVPRKPKGVGSYLITVFFRCGVKSLFSITLITDRVWSIHLPAPGRDRRDRSARSSPPGPIASGVAVKRSWWCTPAPTNVVKRSSVYSRVPVQCSSPMWLCSLLACSGRLYARNETPLHCVCVCWCRFSNPDPFWCKYQLTTHTYTHPTHTYTPHTQISSPPTLEFAATQKTKSIRKRRLSCGRSEEFFFA